MFDPMPSFPLLASAIPAYIGAVTPPLRRTDAFSRFGFSYTLAMSVVALIQTSNNLPHLHLRIIISNFEIPYFFFLAVHFVIVLLFSMVYYFTMRVNIPIIRITFATFAFSAAVFLGAHAAFSRQLYILT